MSGIFILAALLSAAAILLLIFNPKTGVLFLFPAMGVVDATWDIRFGGFSLIQLLSAAVAGIVYMQVCADQRLPKWWQRIALLFLLCNSAGALWGMLNGNASPKGLLESFLRALNVYISFFMLPLFFDTREKFKMLLYAILIAAFFPLCVQFFQISVGTDFGHLRQTRGLMRMVGLYHDAVTNKIFFTQALGAGVLLLGAKLEENVLRRWLIFGYMLVILCGIYFIFSKSAVAILLLWSIGLASFGKKLHWLLWGALFALIFDAFSEQSVWGNIYKIFERDIAVQQGEMDSQYALSGRGVVWANWLDYFWSEGGTFDRLLGYGEIVSAHNEWLRIMIFGGFISLMLTILMQIVVFFKILNAMLSKGTFCMVFAMLLFLTYLLDCIGIVPGLYPQYNWYLWGILGCILFNRSIFENQKEPDDVRRTDSSN